MRTFTLILITCSTVLFSACTAGSQPANTSNSGSDTTTTNAPSQTQTAYSLEEVARHNTPADCWMAVGADVYAVSDYIAQHPGGDTIAAGCGLDATTLFNSERKHRSSETKMDLSDLKIGTLAAE